MHFPTISLRPDGGLNIDFTEFQMNLMLYVRIHFQIVFMHRPSTQKKLFMNICQLRK